MQPSDIANYRVKKTSGMSVPILAKLHELRLPVWAKQSEPQLLQFDELTACH
jgi:hypothetical protein